MSVARVSPLILRLTACAALALSAMAEDIKPDVPSREVAVLMTVTAKVEAIDQGKREVTLKGPLGNVVSFVVGDQVKRLDEIAVGDAVTAEYYLSLAGELREPTEEEKAHPITTLEVEGRAPKSELPAGLSVRAYKVLANIVGLDLPTQTISLMGPRGRIVVIRASSLENMMELRLGASVIVTYTEAVAVSLTKIQSGAK